MNNNIKKAQQLVDCYKKNNPNQTFTCFGPTGPTGPAGEDAEVTYAYASKYQTDTQTISLTANVITQVPLANNGPSINVTNSEANKFTIIEEGVYKIDYSFAGTSSAAATITVEARNNGNTINGGKTSRVVTASGLADIQGSTLVELEATNEIDLAISSSENATITPVTNTNAYLIIEKID